MLPLCIPFSRQPDTLDHSFSLVNGAGFQVLQFHVNPPSGEKAWWVLHAVPVRWGQPLRRPAGRWAVLLSSVAPHPRCYPPPTPPCGLPRASCATTARSACAAAELRIAYYASFAGSYLTYVTVTATDGFINIIGTKATFPFAWLKVRRCLWLHVSSRDSVREFRKACAAVCANVTILWLSPTGALSAHASRLCMCACNGEGFFAFALLFLPHATGTTTPPLPLTQPLPGEWGKEPA
jgi:hypothetical protein